MFENMQPDIYFGNVKTSIFYVNDLHGKINAMGPLKQAAEEYRADAKKRGNDTFTLLGGDTKVGMDGKSNNLALLWMELIGAELSSLGNHELDVGEKKFAAQLRSMDFIAQEKLPQSFKGKSGMNPYRPQVKFLASNLQLGRSSDNPFRPLFRTFMEKTGGKWINEEKNGDVKILESCVIEKNGNKYGFLGLTVPALHNYHEVGQEPGQYIFSPAKLSETIKLLQKKIDKLRYKHGVNKIGAR